MECANSWFGALPVERVPDKAIWKAPRALGVALIIGQRDWRLTYGIGISRMPDVAVTALADDARAMFPLIEHLRPPLVILDYELPDGQAEGFLHAVGALPEQQRPTVITTLTTSLASREYAPRPWSGAEQCALGAAAHIDYWPEDDEIEYILRAVAAGARGPEVVRRIPLNATQSGILHLTEQGLDPAQIAATIEEDFPYSDGCFERLAVRLGYARSVPSLAAIAADTKMLGLR
jgi:hypothetical protein